MTFEAAQLADDILIPITRLLESGVGMGGEINEMSRENLFGLLIHHCKDRISKDPNILASWKRNNKRREEKQKQR